MKKNSAFLTIAAFLFVFNSQAALARERVDHHDGRTDHHADRNDHDRGDHHVVFSHHHPFYGRIVSIPHLLGIRAFFHAGLEYFYNDGYFYRRVPQGYMIVDAPAGVVISSLPVGVRIVVYNGKHFYYYNETYYLRAQTGYVVVDDPVYQVVDLPQQVKVVESPITVPAATDENLDGKYTINIPSATGGNYTPVTLKRSGNGFLGPQGEYYDQFPSVEQLRLMYGK
jgi:hypothetical protein